MPGRYSFVPEGAVASDAGFRRIAKLADANSVPYLDLQPAFRGYSGDSPLYFQHDMHMTAAGQLLMADGIAKFVADRDLPAWCTAGID